MKADFPDDGTIRAALSLAIRAPSFHNSQPWRWRVGPRSLHLYADGGHGRPDLGDRAVHLSCGAALNHCVVGLAALGWGAKIRRFPGTHSPRHLAAIELHRCQASEADVTLAAAIPRRRTDRRPYSAWPVPRGDLALMGARAARAGVAMRRVEALSDLPILQASSVSGQAADVECPSHARDHRLGTDDAVVVALGTTCDDAMAHLRAGEATSVVVLTATALGLASCPVTELLGTSEDREFLRQNVFQEGSYAQMLLRVGWAPVNADPLPPSPRNDFADVVEWLDDDGGPS